MSGYKWGCCPYGDDNDKQSFIKCNGCNQNYHFSCIAEVKSSFSSESALLWKCLICKPKTNANKNDDTPVRSVNATRGNKRQAFNSPEIPEPDTGFAAVTKNDVHDIIKSAISSELDKIVDKLSNTVSKSLDTKLKPLETEMSKMRDSMDFLSHKYDELLKEHVAMKEVMKVVQDDNSLLKVTVNELNLKVEQLEQQARSNNIEIQCVPERKQENVLEIIMNLSKAIDCKLDQTDIMNCTRIAKLRQDSPRPRSIVVQLASPRLRDQFIASVANFNKVNSKDKLNSTHLGLSGTTVPIFVCEHLTPTNKALHAAVRQKAKEAGYKFVWIRSGKIFVRKEVDSSYILIKNKDSLSKIV